MKITIAFFVMVLSLTAVAEVKRLSPHSSPEISDVLVKTLKEAKAYSCPEDALYEEHGCQQIEQSSRKIVRVSIKYIISQENPIDQLEAVTGEFNLDLSQSEFSEDELASLAQKDYQSRLAAAKQLIELKIKNKTHTEYFTPMKVLEVEVHKK